MPRQIVYKTIHFVISLSHHKPLPHCQTDRVITLSLGSHSLLAKEISILITALGNSITKRKWADQRSPEWLLIICRSVSVPWNLSSLNCPSVVWNGGGFGWVFYIHIFRACLSMSIHRTQEFGTQTNCSLNAFQRAITALKTIAIDCGNRRSSSPPGATRVSALWPMAPGQQIFPTTNLTPPCLQFLPLFH